MDIKIEKASVTSNGDKRMLDRNWTVEMEDVVCWPPDGPERELLKKHIEEILMEEISKEDDE